MKKVLLAVLTVHLAAGWAVAAEWPAVESRKAGDIAYVNGGFGREERAVMRADYPLRIAFATERGLYLSGVDTVIYDGSGRKVFEVRADDGPWLQVGLKPGQYRLEATHNGVKKTVGALSVPARGMNSVLVRWKTSEVDMGLKD